MPELPDVAVYIAALERRIVGRTLRRVRLESPFLLRSVEPPLAALHGLRVDAVRRLGKRIVLAFEGELFCVLHLMIAGRLQWRDAPDAKLPGRIGLAAFDFEHGTLVVTEAGSKRRARLHVVRGEDELRGHDPHGLEPLDATLAAFAARLAEENHTLKRALTDPTLFSGIGNAYSDEILHRAKLSPFARTADLAPETVARLHAAVHEVLAEWIERLCEQTGDDFPSKVTAFRPEMAVHGQHGRPCPVCGDPVQRVVFTDREFNYCATCQTGGKLLKDRALSQLLRDDWPKTVEELELRRRRAQE